MTDEIKEILEELENKDNYVEEFGYMFKRISLYDSFQLLDYITNLQQENERLKNQINDIKRLDRMRFNMLISHYGILRENK